MAYDPANNGKNKCKHKSTRNNKGKPRKKTPSEPILTGVRIADFGGKISWKITHKQYLEYGGNTYKFEIQTPALFAVIEKRIYKHWRVVMKKGYYRITGRVIAEFDTKSDAQNCLSKIENIFKKGFDKDVIIKENENPELIAAWILFHGDVISVPSKMGRHYAIYDFHNKSVIEYQPPPGMSILYILIYKICCFIINITQYILYKL